MHLSITVTGVEYVERYVIRVSFADGFSHLVDLEDELHGEVFEPLKDFAVFREVRFDEEARTAVWPNGADLAPEFLRYGPDRPDCPCPIHAAGRRLAAQSDF